MTVKIYGAWFMSNVQRVAVICEELGVDYQVIPDYKQTRSPFGHVPVLVDENGFQLYESRAICRYLVMKYGGNKSTLLPSSSNPEECGLFEQAASIEYSFFEPSALVIAWERVLAKKFGQPSDENEAQKHEEIIKDRMKGYDRVLAGTRYLAGNAVTLADLFHLPYGIYIEDLMPETLAANPNVQKWWKDISSRQSWKTVQLKKAEAGK